MKRIVSVSLGSSRRDHAARLSVLGQDITVERIGTDGDMDKAVQLIESLDGKVDAFGMGGIDLYIWVGQRRYTFREARRIALAARRTPIVDGSGLKNTLERAVVRYLVENDFALQGKNVLMTSAADRFGMAESLAQAGCNMVFGDLMFALGLSVPLRTIRSLQMTARVLAPVVVQLPFKWLYPTGTKQEVNKPRFDGYFRWADIIAGDWHFIRRHMPGRLEGKTVLTNTVTEADVSELRQRGAGLLITTTPELDGRSFGTNVMEAVLVALAGCGPDDLSADDYNEWLARLDLRPRIERFAAAPGEEVAHAYKTVEA